MATKKNRSLRGGVGNAPAGRGGMADQLFEAREGVRINDPARIGTDEFDVMPPTPENRSIDTFDTVRESLIDTLGINAADNAKRKFLNNAVEAMLQLIDEGYEGTDRTPPRIAPDEVERYGQVVRAYQDAFNAQTPQQQAVILAAVPESRRGEFQQFYGGPFAKAALGQKARDITADGGRAALAQAMDYVGDADEYAERVGQDVAARRPYGGTNEGSQQSSILRTLMDEYGIPAEAIDNASVGDAVLPPFDPGPGVMLSREDYPPRQRLSPLIGDVANQGRMRFGEDVDDIRVGQELLGQFFNIEKETARRMAEGLPTAEPYMVEPPSGVSASDLPYNAIVTSFDPNVTDNIVRDQMRSPVAKIRDEIHNRAFGTPTVLGDMRDRGALVADPRNELTSPIDVRRMAPWTDGTTTQVVDGREVRAPLNAEQIVDTILSQSMYAAEAPNVRAAARDLLLPQVQRALEQQPLDPKRVYNRSELGRRLLEEDGMVQPMAPPTPRPPATGGMSMEQIKEQLRRRASAKGNDLGFTQPPQVPQYMASAMPNRMLAGLLG